VGHRALGHPPARCASRACGMLFESHYRPTDRPKGYAESSYRFLARSTRSSFAAVRQVLEEWHARFPEDERTDLRERFRSKSDTQHLSAFFELWAHELLLRSGCEIQAVHPQLDDRQTHPDFLVRGPSGLLFYVEVTASSSRFPMPDSARVRLVLDAINDLDSPDFFVNILRQSGAPRTSPRIRQLRAILTRWLAGLDHAAAMASMERGAFNELPKICWDWDGWEVEFTAHPTAKLRGAAGVRTLGIQGVYPGFSASASTLRDRVETKAECYGRMPHPYLLMINNYDLSLELGDVQQALLGSRDGVLGAGDDEACRQGGSEDAVWVQRGRQRNRQLSAVLVAKQVLPWSPGGELAVVCHNPWAWDPLPEGLLGLTALCPRDGRMVQCSGQPVTDILDLPGGWPRNADV